VSTVEYLRINRLSKTNKTKTCLLTTEKRKKKHVDIAFVFLFSKQQKNLYVRLLIGKQSNG